MEDKIVSKAFSCSIIYENYEPTIIYASTHNKARHAYVLGLDYDYKYTEVKALRNREYDLVKNTPLPIVEHLSIRQLEKMAHTIGEDYHVKEPYRNYYSCSQPDKDFEELVSKKMAIKQIYKTSNYIYYHLTNYGIEVIKSNNPIRRNNKNDDKKEHASIS